MTPSRICFLSKALGVYAILVFPSTGSGYTRPVSLSLAREMNPVERSCLATKRLKSRPDVQGKRGRKEEGIIAVHSSFVPWPWPSRFWNSSQTAVRIPPSQGLVF